MDPITTAALITGGFGLFGASKQNQASSAQSVRQMEFQERMSNTSHQRQMADMRTAGLNPILSGKYGGASSPAGSAAPQVDVVQPAVNSALTLQRQRAEIKLIKTNDLNAKRTGYNIMADTQFKEQNTMNSAQDFIMKNLTIPGLRQEWRLDKSGYGKTMRALMRANPFVNSAKGLQLGPRR